MQLPDAADMGKLAKLTPAALWVYVNAMVYSTTQRTKGYVPAVLAQDWSVRSCGGKPVAELLQRGLWRKQGVGFQILPSYASKVHTDSEIELERERLVRQWELEKGGVNDENRSEATRWFTYHLSRFMYGVPVDPPL